MRRTVAMSRTSRMRRTPILGRWSSAGEGPRRVRLLRRAPSQRSLSPRRKEDLELIEHKKDQSLNPWRYRTYIDGGQITGPLRPDPATARQDRARMEEKHQELKKEGLTGKELAKAMRAYAKIVKDEAKATKKEQTKENRRTYKRDSYRASQEAKKQASQEGTPRRPAAESKQRMERLEAQA